MAAANAGQYGDRGDLPAELERAELCERLNWRILPWEMDDLDLDKVRTPLYLLNVQSLFEAYSKDIKSVGEETADLIALVEKWRQDQE